eukprot:3763431-Amphidinium_carterae.1
MPRLSQYDMQLNVAPKHQWVRLIAVCCLKITSARQLPWSVHCMALLTPRASAPFEAIADNDSNLEKHQLHLKGSSSTCS